MSINTINHENILCTDCGQLVLSFFHCTETALLNKKYADQASAKLNNAARVLQRWYRNRKLHGEKPYNQVTLKTLKRFYITKYDEDWLKNFTQGAVYKLGLVTHALADKYINPTPAMRQAFVRTFYQFCDDFNITVGDLYHYGW